MALKDWRNIGRSYENINKYWYMWQNKITNEVISIFNHSASNTEFEIFIKIGRNGDSKLIKKTKNKKTAFKFAKHYMKLH